MNTTRNHGLRVHTCVCASISRLTVAPLPLPPRPVARSVSGIRYTVNQSGPTSPTCAAAAHLKGIKESCVILSAKEYWDTMDYKMSAM